MLNRGFFVVYLKIFKTPLPSTFGSTPELLTTYFTHLSWSVSTTGLFQHDTGQFKSHHEQQLLLVEGAENSNGGANQPQPSVRLTAAHGLDYNSSAEMSATHGLMTVIS